MDEIFVKRKAIFFNNLLLLGLHQEAFGKKHGIPFHKDMFNLPNKKGYEVVTHFLFSKLSAATGKDFNLPWPLLNKELDRIFQKTCYTHFISFAQENEVKFPRIVPSLLSTFGGDRFYEVYLAFSCYVLNKTIRKNANINLLSRPSISRENFNTVKEVVQLSTIQSTEKFIATETVTHMNDLVWTKFAKNLSECLQKLKQLLRSKEDLLKRNISAISSIYSTVEENFKLEDLVEKSLNCWKPAKKQRKNLEQFFTDEETLWKYIASEVDENIDSDVLNGQDFNIGIINNLPEKFCFELAKIGFSSSKQDEKLSIIRFIKLLMAYLKSIAELLNRADMSDLHETFYVNDASSIEHDLYSINSLNKKLNEDIIPDLEESIKQLKLINSFEDLEETLESSFSQICSLSVLSYNPEAVKERTSLIDPNLEEKLRLPTSEEIVGSDISHAHLSVSKNISEVNNSCMDLPNFNKPNYDTVVYTPDAIARTTILADSSKQKLVSERTNFSNSSNSTKSNVGTVEGHSSSSNLNISNLDDIDFAPSTHFKMRGSWLQEESLNTMTLPDISFDD